MMQDDKGNIKVNLGIALVKQLAGFYCGISVFCLYTDTVLYNNKNDHTTFLPLSTEIGGPVKCVKDTENIHLTTDQARHVYKKVELEGIVNVDTIKQDIEEDNLRKVI